ncbi:MAG: Gfo/Idh/MocA family oxidoreductase [Microthrixaceae bacterium]|nr:Gfo/Idh/MocA family oxidoreductase [Microthrixaceae bacterium]
MSLTGVVVGAGDRGYDGYAKVLLDRPELGRIVAAADPDPTRRDRFADRFGLGTADMYPGWDELFAEGRLADYAIITTGDTHHVEPALLALDAGYHVLLEKPMALEEADCVRIVEAAEAADRTVAVCHVFRHSHLFAALGEVVASGELGDVTSIQLSENVAFWHYAHSYVRGHTRNSRVPWLLQKSCHDLDLLQWLAGSRAAAVSSFIRPTELTAANAPADAPEHCAQGCPHSDTCPYDAVATYRDLTPVLSDLAMADRPVGLGPAARVARSALPKLLDADVAGSARRLQWKRWPVAAVTDDPTPEGLDHALRTTRWGRCVYRIDDNDQPSAQTVSIRFVNGVVANFTLNSNSHRTMRSVRVDGTRGTAWGELRALDGWLKVSDHRSGRVRRVKVPTAYDGHGGGEAPLFVEFLDAIRTGTEPSVSAAESLESHRIAFAAMESASSGRVVELSAG